MPTSGWWADDSPLYLADGRHFRSRGRAKKIWLPSSHRGRHLYGIGGTGSGKSRFIRHCLFQDIRAGRGCCLIDPHGDLFKETLTYIGHLVFGRGPPTTQRVAQLGDKLIIIQPDDLRFGAPGINLLQVYPGQHPYQIVDGILRIVRTIWKDAYGARMDDLLRNTLLLLQEHQLTLGEVVPVLSNPQLRQSLVGRCRNPDVRVFFQQHLGELKVSEWRVWIESTRNKFSALMGSPFMRWMFGQTETTIDFATGMNNGACILIHMARDKMKDSTRIATPALTFCIQNGILSRETIPEHERVVCNLYIDEFAEAFSDVLLDGLTGSRKLGLALHLFHQNLSQDPLNDPSITDTILTNTHTHVVFNVARKDAQRLAGEVFSASGKEVKFQRRFFGIPLERPTLWSMGDEKEAYVIELTSQRQSEAFIRFRGVGDDEPYMCKVPFVEDIAIDHEKIDALKQHVARRYYRPIPQIEREIQQRQANLTPVNVRPAQTDYRQ